MASISVERGVLRYLESTPVRISFSEPVTGFTPNAVTASGGTLEGWMQASDGSWNATFRSASSTGDTMAITVARGAFHNATGNVNKAATREIMIDKRPPIQFAMHSEPLTYTPERRYSWYNPQEGTQNIYYSDFEVPQFFGENLKSKILVLVQYAKNLAYFRENGSVIWTYPQYGRFVTATRSNILVGNAGDFKKVDVLNFDGKLKFAMDFDHEINYARVVGDKLIILYGDVLPAEIYAWDEVRGKGALIWTGATVEYARSADIEGDHVVIADTFGHRTVVQSLSTGAILDSIPTFYPNDVSLRGHFVYILSEHQDQLFAYNIHSKEKFVVMAPPDPLLWRNDLPVHTDPLEFCGNDAPLPRSKSSDQCSGQFTLYAPNGFAIADGGLYVADTDNARVIFVKDNRVKSVLVGLNNPVKIVPVPAGAGAG